LKRNIVKENNTKHTSRTNEKEVALRETNRVLEVYEKSNTPPKNNLQFC